MTKPWHKNEWKEKRKVILNDRDTCEKCGSHGKLCLHHPKGDFRSPAEIRKAINDEAYQAFKREYEKSQTAKKPVLTGRHRHKSHDHWHDSATKHRTEVDESNLMFEKKIPARTHEEKENFTIAYTDWKDKNGIKKCIEEEIEKETKRYESLKGVMVLCMRCHKSIHEGWEICPICTDTFKSLNDRTCWYCRADEEKEKIPATDPQKEYIKSLMTGFSTTEKDKEYVKVFLQKIRKDSLDALYKEEAHVLINKLIAITVPIKMPCGDLSGVPKNELNRSKYLEDSWLCYYHCPNESYNSQECDRFPKEKNIWNGA